MENTTACEPPSHVGYWSSIPGVSDYAAPTLNTTLTLHRERQLNAINANGVNGNHRFNQTSAGKIDKGCSTVLALVMHWLCSTDSWLGLKSSGYFLQNEAYELEYSLCFHLPDTVAPQQHFHVRNTASEAPA